MRHVPASEFKAKCLELLDRVAQCRESFLITKRGRAVARLVPVERKPMGRRHVRLVVDRKDGEPRPN